jgi:hypothetical protein
LFPALVYDGGMNARLDMMFERLLADPDVPAWVHGQVSQKTNGTAASRLSTGILRT